MTARLRYGTVLAASPGIATVELDGAQVSVPVTNAQTLTVAETAILTQDGRRIVALGTRGNVIPTVTPLPNPPPTPGGEILTGYGTFDPATGIATDASVTITYDEFDIVVVLQGSPASPPSWLTGAGVAQSAGSLTVTGRVVAVGRMWGCTRVWPIAGDGASGTEESAVYGWILDGSSRPTSVIPDGAVCLSYGYAWASANRQYNDAPIQFRHLDADAEYMTGGDTLWPGTWPANTADRFFATSGRAWIKNASSPATVGDAEWRGPAGYLNTTDAAAGIVVTWANPVEHEQ